MALRITLDKTMNFLKHYWLWGVVGLVGFTGLSFIASTFHAAAIAVVIFDAILLYAHRTAGGRYLRFLNPIGFWMGCILVVLLVWSIPLYQLWLSIPLAILGAMSSIGYLMSFHSETFLEWAAVGATISLNGLCMFVLLIPAHLFVRLLVF